MQDFALPLQLKKLALLSNEPRTRAKHFESLERLWLVLSTVKCNPTLAIDNHMMSKSPKCAATKRTKALLLFQRRCTTMDHVDHVCVSGLRAKMCRILSDTTGFQKHLRLNDKS